MQGHSAAIVELAHVGKDFGGTKARTTRSAVRDVSFQLTPGEVLCIVGKSGCGKSTLVNMLLGLEMPSRGTISVYGAPLSEQSSAHQRRIAAVFQTDRLLPWRSVIDNAALGLEAAGMPKKQRHAAALPWLERVGLAGWGDHYPHELSGGMRQRVAICRAFVQEPQVIILDEAFGHLDEVTAQQLRQECLGIIAEVHTAVIVVTHNIAEALDIGHRVIVLGRPAHVLREFDLTALKDSAAKADLHREIFHLIEERSEAAT